ncbi:hypothetical protein ACGTNG_12725 [Halomonas sp. 1390]|uniref:hypothetical protein n=1 Tax=Halomonas sp. B23F22_3 TaxID=3459516 RepID=UPI00373F53BE
MTFIERRTRVAEHRAQQRARGAIIRGPERPIIGSRWNQPKDPANAARAVEFHARWHDRAEPRLQLWRA